MTKYLASPPELSRLDALHHHFLTILPRIETHARIHFRHLRCPGRRDDAVAEVVAVCWRWFLRISENGKDAGEFAATLADYAVRRVRSGRNLCGQERSKDVLSPLARRRHGFTLEPLASPACPCHDARQQREVMEERLKDNARSPVPEQAAFRIDFPRWHRSHCDRNRRLIDGMARDERTLDLADQFGISPGRVSQLRREFRDGWRHFHGESDQSSLALA